MGGWEGSHVDGLGSPRRSRHPTMCFVWVLSLSLYRFSVCQNLTMGHLEKGWG